MAVQLLDGVVNCIALGKGDPVLQGDPAWRCPHTQSIQDGPLAQTAAYQVGDVDHVPFPVCLVLAVAGVSQRLYQYAVLG
ncbi:hypothetical protein JT27_18275 [Alcaligenes faecalis]|nr:hypothetical protein JT27_18275 [Alcaligenes faecalis]